MSDSRKTSNGHQWNVYTEGQESKFFSGWNEITVGGISLYLSSAIQISIPHVIHLVMSRHLSKGVRGNMVRILFRDRDNCWLDDTRYIHTHIHSFVLLRINQYQELNLKSPCIFGWLFTVASQCLMTRSIHKLFHEKNGKSFNFLNCLVNGIQNFCQYDTVQRTYSSIQSRSITSIISNLKIIELNCNNCLRDRYQYLYNAVTYSKNLMQSDVAHTKIRKIN